MIDFTNIDRERNKQLQHVELFETGFYFLIKRFKTFYIII